MEIISEVSRTAVLPFAPSCGFGVSLWMKTGCLNIEPGNLPLVAMLDQPKRDRGFGIVELRFWGV